MYKPARNFTSHVLDDAHHNGAAEFHLVARQHSACSGLFSWTPRGPARVPTNLPEACWARFLASDVSHLGRMNACKGEKILNSKHKFTLTARAANKIPRRPRNLKKCKNTHEQDETDLDHGSTPTGRRTLGGSSPSHQRTLEKGDYCFSDSDFQSQSTISSRV